ncbi:MAG TPA: glycosyltransferase [Terriglobales bacterium]|jgi:glycosyltransferase involved in cell wall biosynthesis|nr:glycosyltransferase [Terriglobales bacterium]
MRVLTLTPFYPTASDNADGCFVAEPLDFVRNCGVECDVVAVRPFYLARPTPNGHAAEWIRYAAVPGGLGLASSGALLYAQLLPKVRRLVRKAPINLIHAHAALPCGHAAMLLKQELGIPYVVTVHGLDAFFTRQVQGFGRQRCYRASQKVYGSADAVVCISRKVATQLENAVAHERLRIVHNGVDEQQFCPAHEHGKGSIILSVGNLIPIKGHELLLRAIAALQAQFPDFVCEIIGDGPERSHLQSLAINLAVSDKVRFLGRQSREHVAQAMRRCSIFALPSSYEGLGCVYIEAMSAGKPIIACRDQGIQDIVEHGRNGWLIAPRDLSSLTDALAILLQDSELRTRLGRNARETVVHNLTLAHQAAQLTEVYEDVAA